MKYIISVDIIVEATRSAKAENIVNEYLLSNMDIEHFEILDVEEMDPLDEDDDK